MNNILNVLGTPQNIADSSATSTGEPLPTDAGAFALLLGLFTPAPAVPSPVTAANLGTDAVTIDAASIAPAPPLERERAEYTPAQALPDTAAPDAGLIADLLGQLQAAYAMAASAPVTSDAARREAIASASVDGPQPESKKGATAAAGFDIDAHPVPAAPALDASATDTEAFNKVRVAERLPLQPVMAPPLPQPNKAGIETASAVLNQGDNTTPSALRTTQALAYIAADPAAPYTLDQPKPPMTGEHGDPVPAAQTSVPKLTDESHSAPVIADAVARALTDGARSPAVAHENHPASTTYPVLVTPNFSQALALNSVANESEATTNAVAAAAVAGANGARARPLPFTDTRDHSDDFSAIAGAAPMTTTPGSDPLPQIGVAPRLDSPEWRPAFAGSVKMMGNEGTSAASLQLNPAELGPIDVRIVMTDQRADISFMVSNTDANAAIQSALTELREQLARSGIQLGQTSVGANPQQYRQPAGTPAHGTATPGTATPGTAAAPGAAPASAHPRSAHRIDTFA